MASVSTLSFLKSRLYTKSRLFKVKYHFGHKLSFVKSRLYVKSRFVKSRLYCLHFRMGRAKRMERMFCELRRGSKKPAAGMSIGRPKGRTRWMRLNIREPGYEMQSDAMRPMDRMGSHRMFQWMWSRSRASKEEMPQFQWFSFGNQPAILQGKTIGFGGFICIHSCLVVGHWVVKHGWAEGVWGVDPLFRQISIYLIFYEDSLRLDDSLKPNSLNPASTVFWNFITA